MNGVCLEEQNDIKNRKSGSGEISLETARKKVLIGTGVIRGEIKKILDEEKITQFGTLNFFHIAYF